ncbi:MAG: hypothetical protein LBR86_09550 [Tannerella sp.]|jgi:hypothetical protein|nr:hypothetical protein [Tannerella sp.]
MGLFIPAWKSKNAEKALRAVEKMTDPEKLARIAKEAKRRDTCMAAVEKLTDQTALVDVAKHAGKWFVREAAVKKVTDQTVLADIAKNDGDSYVRKAAINSEHFTDPDLLADVAKNAGDAEVRGAANANIAYNADVRKFGKERAGYRAGLRAERTRMQDGIHDYPYEGCTEPELSEWWREYEAEFGKEE